MLKPAEELNPALLQELYRLLQWVLTTENTADCQNISRPASCEMSASKVPGIRAERTSCYGCALSCLGLVVSI